MKWLAIIVAMSAVTYATKATILLLGDRIRLAPPVRRALTFVPIAVLTAIIVPLTLAPQGRGLEFGWGNPQLIGAGAATLAGLRTRQPLLTIAVGMAVYLAWRLLVLA